jgi:Flp pilus assembly protein TadD
VRDASPDTFYGVAADDLSHPVLPPGYPPFITSELPPPASLAELKAAAVAQPGALQAQLNYAAALVADGQRRAAIDAFDAALAVDPGSLDARVGRIIAGYSKDNPAAAFGQMGPLVRDNPSDPSPRLHLALMLLWLRDPETARAEFRQVATLAPDTRLGRTAQQFLDAL